MFLNENDIQTINADFCLYILRGSKINKKISYGENKFNIHGISKMSATDPEGGTGAGAPLS